MTARLFRWTCVVVICAGVSPLFPPRFTRGVLNEAWPDGPGNRWDFRGDDSKGADSALQRIINQLGRAVIDILRCAFFSGTRAKGEFTNASASRVNKTVKYSLAAVG